MTPQPPAAFRPLVLLTLAVLVAHLVLLDQAPRHSPAKSPPLRSLVTRVLMIAPPSQGEPASQPEPALQERAGRHLPARAPRAAATQRNLAPEGTPQRAPDPKPAADAGVPPPATEGVGEAASAIPSATVAAPVPEATPAPAADAPAPVGAATGPGLAFAIPGSVRLRYAVTGQSRGQDWSVNGELLWRHDGSQYEASLQYSAPPLRSRLQRSTGRLTAEGLAPQRFSDQRRGEQATHFERESGRLVFSNNAPAQPLAPGMQDRLSVFLQLAALVAAAPSRFPPGSEITLPTAGTRDAQPWLFKVQGDDILALPGGLVETRKLVRDPLGEYEPRIEIWLGAGMDYMPARIRLTQPNGDYVDQQWSSTDRP